MSWENSNLHGGLVVWFGSISLLINTVVKLKLTYLALWIKCDCGLGNFQHLINSEDTGETKAPGCPTSMLWCDVTANYLELAF